MVNSKCKMMQEIRREKKEAGERHAMKCET